ncbi:hypothetical protein NECAME_01197, partial [Necator americanus]
LFHLITGYGIARTLKRTHYLPFKKGVRDHVIKYLQQFSLIFPRLEQTYVLAEDGINQTQVSFAGSCCAYDNPLRLSNNTDTYLLLNFIYGQNPRYFEDYLPDIREILQFSVEMRRNGSEVVNVLKRTHSNLMCIHIRRTDFIKRKISTDLSETVNAANNIAKQMNISQFMIFGDDQQFMRNMSFAIVRDGKWADNIMMDSSFFFNNSDLDESFGHLLLDSDAEDNDGEIDDSQADALVLCPKNDFDSDSSSMSTISSDDASEGWTSDAEADNIEDWIELFGSPRAR